MATEGLICNMKGCRKGIAGKAYVTSCSHVFCEEDGQKQLNRALVCPACETSLTRKFDIILMDVNPSEEYKSMVLAGHRPDVIVEICSRAISFWNFQMQQEKLYRDSYTDKLKERTAQLEQYYTELLTKLQNESTTAKRKLKQMNQEFESLKHKYEELNEKYGEKCRSMEKLYAAKEELRRKAMATPKAHTFMATPGPMQRGNNFAMHLANGNELLAPFNGVATRTSPTFRAQGGFVQPPFQLNLETPKHSAVPDPQPPSHHGVWPH